MDMERKISLESARVTEAAAVAAARWMGKGNKNKADNLKIVSENLKKSISDLTVVILDRPKHEQLIKEVRETSARIMLISDGDVSPAIACAFESSGIDIMIRIGGAPEGILAAAALKCLGGEFDGEVKT